MCAPPPPLHFFHLKAPPIGWVLWGQCVCVCVGRWGMFFLVTADAQPVQAQDIPALTVSPRWSLQPPSCFSSSANRLLLCGAGSL